MARIVIIDDDTNLRTIIRQMLEGAGHQVREACDGAEAMSFISESPVDLVITDVIMPEKEGIETVIELHKKRPDVKIIVMSGGGRFGPEDYLETAVAFGANHTIAKPFGRNEMLKAVERLLEQKKPQSAEIAD